MRRAKFGATISQKSISNAGNSGKNKVAARKTNYPLKRQATRMKTATTRTKNYLMTEKDKEAKLKQKYKISTKLKKGPIIDSAATVPILTVKDSKQCQSVTELKTPQKLDTIDGVTTAKKSGSIELPVVGIKDGLILPEAKESVIPLADICGPGTGMAYYQDEKGAALVNTKKNKVYECIPDGKVYRLPLTKEQEVSRQIVNVAELMVNKERNQRKALQMLQHVKNLHKPKMPVGMCATCDETRVLANQEIQPVIGQKQDEILSKADLIELGDPDINGYRYLLTVTTQHGVKAARGSKTKSAEELKTVVMDTIQDIKNLYPHGICVEVSFSFRCGKRIYCSSKEETTRS